MIVGFSGRKTEMFYEGRRLLGVRPDRLAKARPVRRGHKPVGGLARPGNCLEEFKGLHNGQWSIRINDKWRTCFKWPEGRPSPTEVEIVDYN